MLKLSFVSIQVRGIPLVVMFLAILAAAPLAGEERLFETKGPVVITSSGLSADNKARTALFEGSVLVKTETMTISSDKMLVSYTEDGKITKIVADGRVKLIKGERVITSDEATYFADEDKVIFTGQPKAVEGTSMVTGTKITYLLKDDRSLVENSKVFMERSPGKR